MNLFKYFKLKKKRKLEQQLKKFILFNEWKIECYEKYPKKIEPPTKEFLNDITCIAMGYDKGLWPSFSKYNVSKELFDKQIQTCDMALNAENKLKRKIENEKLEREQREQINLYKKAILELRKEDKV